MSVWLGLILNLDFKIGWSPIKILGNMAHPLNSNLSKCFLYGLKTDQLDWGQLKLYG